VPAKVPPPPQGFEIPPEKTFVDKQSNQALILIYLIAPLKFIPISSDFTHAVYVGHGVGAAKSCIIWPSIVCVIGAFASI